MLPIVEVPSSVGLFAAVYIGSVFLITAPHTHLKATSSIPSIPNTYTLSSHPTEAFYGSKVHSRNPSAIYLLLYSTSSRDTLALPQTIRLNVIILSLADHRET